MCFTDISTGVIDGHKIQDLVGLGVRVMWNPTAILLEQNQLLRAVSDVDSGSDELLVS